MGKESSSCGHLILSCTIERHKRSRMPKHKAPKTKYTARYEPAPINKSSQRQRPNCAKGTSKYTTSPHIQETKTDSTPGPNHPNSYCTLIVAGIMHSQTHEPAHCWAAGWRPWPRLTPHKTPLPSPPGLHCRSALAAGTHPLHPCWTLPPPESRC